MTQLSDTQAILLSTAAQRDNGSLLPLAANLKPGGGATKAMGVLVARGLAEERETSDPSAVRRVDGEQRFGLFLTPAGAAAIGVTAPTTQPTQPTLKVGATTGGTKAPAKTNLVLALLHRPCGATLAELIALTGWLPHTTRAALTGLRKKGHDVTRGKRDGVTFYAVVAK